MRTRKKLTSARRNIKKTATSARKKTGVSKLPKAVRSVMSKGATKLKRLRKAI